MPKAETAFQELKRLVEEGSIGSMGAIPTPVLGIIIPKTTVALKKKKGKKSDKPHV